MENVVHSKLFFSLRTPLPKRCFFYLISNMNYVSYHINFFALFTRNLRTNLWSFSRQWRNIYTLQFMYIQPRQYLTFVSIFNFLLLTFPPLLLYAILVSSMFFFCVTANPFLEQGKKLIHTYIHMQINTHLLILGSFQAFSH